MKADICIWENYTWLIKVSLWHDLFPHLQIWGFYVCQQTHIPHPYWAHSSRLILETCSADSRPESPAAAWIWEQDLVREVLTFASWPCPSKFPGKSELLWWLHKVQVQHPPAVFLLQGNNVDITPAEVYIHQTVANYFELMWASQCQWGYLIHQTPAARNYSWFPYPGDN